MFFGPPFHFSSLNFRFHSCLDKIAEKLPNMISTSFLPTTDSGTFKRLVQSTEGGTNAGKLSKVG
jgi:hypothetical protein